MNAIFADAKNRGAGSPEHQRFSYGLVEIKDRVENFHGNQVVYVHWERHLMFCAALALPLSPAMPFGALVTEVLPKLYGIHPDFAKIDWAGVSWTLDHEPWSPKLDKSLADNGIAHKSLVRFATPGLEGIGGSGA